MAGNTGVLNSDVTGTFTSLGNNLIGKTDGSSGWIASDLTGTVASPLNALLAPLGNYGGPTQTMALLPGSPAIDAGASSGGNILPTDQRGLSRVGNTDIGAFESQGFTLTPVAGSTPQRTSPGTAFANPLAVSVTANNAVEPVNGGLIAFTAPPSGPTATLATSPATIAGGLASVTATANSTEGSYTVTASATGANPGSFALDNALPPTANPQSVVLPDNGVTTITLTGSDALTPAANLVYTVTSLPATGTLDDQNGAAVTVGETFVGSAATLTYLMPAVYIGSLSTSFNFTVTDSGFPPGSGVDALTSTPATVAISTPSGSTGVVRVHGTSGNDSIAIGKTTTGNFLQATINGSVVSNSIPLSSISEVDVDGLAGNNVFDVSGWTGAGQLVGAGNDTVVATKNANFILSNSLLTASDGLSMTLSGFVAAELFGGAGNQQFDVSGWTGRGELVGNGGNDTVVSAKTVNQTLTNSRLIATDGLHIPLIGIANADLTDSSTGTHAAVFLDVSGWTGGGALVGSGNDTVVATKNSNFTLSDSLVTASDGLSMTLSGFVVAELFGGAGNQQFDVSGWTGRGELVGNGGSDTVVSAKAGNQILTNSQLSASDGLHIPLIGIANADLTDSATGTHPANYLYVSGWTGGGALVGSGNDGVVATKTANFTLTDTLITASDGLSMTLSGLVVAELTGGAGDQQFDVSGWTGRGELVGNGGNDTVVSAKPGIQILTNSLLTAADGLHIPLIGIANANLTDSATGTHSSNYFYVTGWTGGGSLTGTGNDGIIATKNADFTLSNSLVAGSDGLNMAITGINRAYLTGGTGNNQFDVSGFTGAGQLVGGGGSDTVVAAKNTHFTLTNTNLTTSDGLHISLSGIGLAKLTDTGGPHTIDASGFSGQDTLTTGAFGDVLYGGSGSNVMNGGAGNDILIGGGGNDTLNGGGGSDLLIGAGGNDSLSSGTGSDLMIGESTTYDSNITALDAILAEWSSSDSYSDRINFLMNGGGLNGSFVLNNSTVINDVAANVLTGGGGTGQNNWYIIYSTGGDTVTNNSPNETITTLP